MNFFLKLWQESDAKVRTMLVAALVVIVLGLAWSGVELGKLAEFLAGN